MNEYMLKGFLFELEKNAEVLLESHLLEEYKEAGLQLKKGWGLVKKVLGAGDDAARATLKRPKNYQSRLVSVVDTNAPGKILTQSASKIGPTTKSVSFKNKSIPIKRGAWDSSQIKKVSVRENRKL